MNVTQIVTHEILIWLEVWTAHVILQIRLEVWVTCRVVGVKWKWKVMLGFGILLLVSSYGSLIVCRRMSIGSGEWSMDSTLIGTTVEVIDLTEYVNDDEVSCSPRKLSEYIDRKN